MREFAEKLSNLATVENLMTRCVHFCFLEREAASFFWPRFSRKRGRNPRKKPWRNVSWLNYKPLAKIQHFYAKKKLTQKRHLGGFSTSLFNCHHYYSVLTSSVNHLGHVTSKGKITLKIFREKWEI